MYSLPGYSKPAKGIIPILQMRKWGWESKCQYQFALCIPPCSGDCDEETAHSAASIHPSSRHSALVKIIKMNKVNYTPKYLMFRDINCPRTHGSFIDPSSGLSKIGQLIWGGAWAWILFFPVLLLFPLCQSHPLLTNKQQLKGKESQAD